MKAGISGYIEITTSSGLSPKMFHNARTALHVSTRYRPCSSWIDMVPNHAEFGFNSGHQNRNLRSAIWAKVKLLHNNLEPRMSQLGHWQRPPRRLRPVLLANRRRTPFAERNVMEGLPGLPDQSALTPANFTTLAPFSVSSAISLPKSAGEPGRGVAPNSASRAFILGSAR